MGNSQPKNLSFVKEETFKEPFKFFFKCDNTNPLTKSSFWTPYNEGDILYLEYKFQEYQNGEKAASNDDDQQYQIDFKQWLEIDKWDPINKRTIQRAIPSQVEHIFRRNRFIIENNEAPLSDILDAESLFGYLIGIDGFAYSEFKIMPGKDVVINIPENLGFGNNLKFEDFEQIKLALIQEIHEIEKTSICHRKWNKNLNVYQQCLENINPQNFYKMIIRMFTMEDCLYTELNKCLKKKEGSKLSFYYASLQAALKYYESSVYHQIKTEKIYKNVNKKSKYVEVYQGSYISPKELEIYKEICSGGNLPKLQLLREFISATFCKVNVEGFFQTNNEKGIQVLHIYQIPLLNPANSPIIYLGRELNIYQNSKECLIKSGSLTEITKIEKFNETRIHIYHMVYEKGVETLNEFEAMGREISIEPTIKDQILKLVTTKRKVFFDFKGVEFAFKNQYSMKMVMNALIHNKSITTLVSPAMVKENPEIVKFFFRMLIQNQNLDLLRIWKNDDLLIGNIENVRALSYFIIDTKIIKLEFFTKFGKGNVENVSLLAGSLGKNNSIKSLCLQRIGIGKGNLENIKLISNIFVYNKTIIDLDLSQNHLGDGSYENLRIIVESLIENQTITKLELSSNNFWDGNQENVKLLVRLLVENKTITHLVLGYEFLGRSKIETTKLLSEALIQNKFITNINFTNCRFAEGNLENVMLLAEIFRKNQTITTVGLAQNCLWFGRCQNVQVLAEALLENKRITRVEVIECLFTCQIPDMKIYKKNLKYFKKLFRKK